MRKNSFMIRLLISVVALIECLILLTFTTYSWIESSSSLIISSGENGMGKKISEGEYINLSVANNLNYQVEVSMDASGNVDLVDNENNMRQDDGGYYRSVRYFKYARASSANGKDFYFQKPGGASYRQGDTADYNTSYTYLDFKLKNTTKTTKGFYFNTSDIFYIKDPSTGNPVSYSSMTATQKKIVEAMRISVQKGSSAPEIYSLTNKSYNAVSAANGATQTISTHGIIGSNYIYTGESSDVPVFESVYTSGSAPVIDDISVRIWFEKNDPDLSGVSDADISSAQIDLNFSFINDNVDYDQIFFDDYAFSNKVGSNGQFVTNEGIGYSMYLHVWNQKLGEISYPMSRVANSDSAAQRWMVSVPIPQVVEDRPAPGQSGTTTQYLTSTSTTQWAKAYFYYGTASGTELYKWPLPGAMAIDTPAQAGRTSSSDPGRNNDYVITDATRYFRNLGVVRSSSSQTTGINGFIQFDRQTNDPMQLVYLRDRATGLTDNMYNSAASGEPNYLYISDNADDTYTMTSSSTPSASGGDTLNIDYSDLPSEILNDSDNIFYFDVPRGWYLQFSDSVGGDYRRTISGETDGKPVPQAQDGMCYYVNYSEERTEQAIIETDHKIGAYTLSDYLPKLSDYGNIDGWVRIYFYFNSTLYNHWDTGIKLRNLWNNQQNWADDIVQVQPTDAMKTGTRINASNTSYTVKGDGTGSQTTTSTTYYNSGIYLNLHNGNSYEEDACKTISACYYDSTDKMFKAYVPSSWLNNGFDVHYNTLAGFYAADSDKLRWSTGSASAIDNTYVYTLLGYSAQKAVASLSADAGVGTWSEVREMKFDTELIDSDISSAYRYKIDLGSSRQYPMIPVDELYLTFRAYVPVDGLSTQGTTSVFSFNRFSSYNTNNVATGTWTPAENIGNTETTYYAIDKTGSANTARGWFHVAVLTDATFENLIDDTLNGQDAAQGASLTYSYTNDNTLNAFAGTPVQTDSRHWVVPMRSGDTIYDTVYFRWIPYPAAQAVQTPTVFTYIHSLGDGIYCVVTELSNQD